MNTPIGFSKINTLNFNQIAEVNKFKAYFEEKYGHKYVITHYRIVDGEFYLMTECGICLF